MGSRPKIKLTLSPFDIKLELISKIFLMLMWGITVYTFLKLPNIIPIHFNGAGKADGYGNKLTILILPIIATIIYVGITQLNKYPHIFNYITKITEDNAQKQYSIATRMLRFLKLGIIIIFSVIVLSTYLTTIGVVSGLGYWFLPFTYALLLIPTIIGISKSLKKNNAC